MKEKQSEWKKQKNNPWSLTSHVCKKDCSWIMCTRWKGIWQLSVIAVANSFCISLQSQCNEQRKSFHICWFLFRIVEEILQITLSHLG